MEEKSFDSPRTPEATLGHMDNDQISTIGFCPESFSKSDFVNLHTSSFYQLQSNWMRFFKLFIFYFF